MSSPIKEVLVVGCGAIGAICALLSSYYFVIVCLQSLVDGRIDAYILKKSGLARVTVVARSNFDSIKCKVPCLEMWKLTSSSRISSRPNHSQQEVW